MTFKNLFNTYFKKITYKTFVNYLETLNILINKRQLYFIVCFIIYRRFKCLLMYFYNQNGNENEISDFLWEERERGLYLLGDEHSMVANLKSASLNEGQIFRIWNCRVANQITPYCLHKKIAAIRLLICIMAKSNESQKLIKKALNTFIPTIASEHHCI